MATETIVLTSAGKKFWGTKKTKVVVTITDKPIRCTGAYWSGGSISEYCFRQKNGAYLPVNGVKTSPFDNGPDAEATPTASLAVVQGGTFCGKPSTLHIYVTTKEGWPW